MNGDCFIFYNLIKTKNSEKHYGGGTHSIKPLRKVFGIGHILKGFYPKGIKPK